MLWGNCIIMILVIKGIRWNYKDRNQIENHHKRSKLKDKSKHKEKKIF